MSDQNDSTVQIAVPLSEFLDFAPRCETTILLFYRNLAAFQFAIW
jgi:hypothetical protein